MRVTNKMMTNNFLRNVQTNQSILKTLDNQLTTGKKFNRPSDNPFAVARSMQLHDQISANNQYNENIKDTINWLDTTDTSLKQATDVYQKFNELLISAGNAGYSEKERLAIKDEINERINEFGQILNTSFDGKYIFGGYNATEKPVKVDGGIKYGNSKLVSVPNDQLKDWDNTKFKVTVDGNDFDVTIGKDYNSIVDLSKDIEKKVEEGYKTELEEKYKGDLDKDAKVAEELSAFKGSFKVLSNAGTNQLEFVSKNGEMSMEDPTNKIGKIEKTEIIDNGDSKLDFNTTDADELEHMSGTLKTEISPGVIVDYSVSANDILKFTNSNGEERDVRNIFKSIVNHLEGKDENGNKIGDEAVEKLLTNDLQDVKDAMENMLTLRAKVGAMQNRMDSAEEKNTDSNFNLTEILSKTEDIDFTEVTMQFAVAQTVYMASLQASAKILQPSLMDYLR